jgi:hypothetical protein
METSLLQNHFHKTLRNQQAAPFIKATESFLQIAQIFSDPKNDKT